MPKVRVIVVGTGGIARSHIEKMLAQAKTTSVVGFVEVSPEQRDKTKALMRDLGIPCPPFHGSIRELVKAQGVADAAFICTPHKFHCENACDCLRLGLDVLIEKPMVLNVSEAQRLIRLRDKTRRLVVVAFNGSLSPAVKKAKELLRAGAIGRITGLAAYTHQRWKTSTAGTWRQDPAISGGGFLFDAGSHMVNTVVELLGEDVVEVTALMDNRGAPVEIVSSVGGRSRSGILFSLAADGDSVHCASRVMVFGTAGVLETGIWGERLNLRTADQRQYAPVACPKSQGVWEQFLKVRAGRIVNPSPPEIGLRFARLMDMIRASAATGRVVRRNGRRTHSQFFRLRNQ